VIRFVAGIAVGDKFTGDAFCEAFKARAELSTGYIRMICLPDTVKPTANDE